jgi:hypothetical protein
LSCSPAFLYAASGKQYFHSFCVFPEHAFVWLTLLFNLLINSVLWSGFLFGVGFPLFHDCWHSVVFLSDLKYPSSLLHACI